MTQDEARQVARKFRRENSRDWDVDIEPPAPWDHPIEGWFVGMYNRITREIRVQEDAS